MSVASFFFNVNFDNYTVPRANMYYYDILMSCLLLRLTAKQAAHHCLTGKYEQYIYSLSHKKSSQI